MSNKFKTLWDKLKPAAERVSFFYVTRGQNYGSTETVRSPIQNAKLGTFAGVSFTIGETDLVLFEDGRIGVDATRKVLKSMR